MRRLVVLATLLALAAVVPSLAKGEVNINLGISLPPPILLPAPPTVVVLPDTDDVYVDPDIDVDLFFWNGWWWRYWGGRWYRSAYYDRGWAYYDYVPSFYYYVDPGWRTYYRHHEWHGHRWDYQRIPYPDVRRNWRSWHNSRYWERRKRWDVHGYRPRTPAQKRELRQQRERQYLQRPEVQRHQRERLQRRGAAGRGYGQHPQRRQGEQPGRRTPAVTERARQPEGQGRGGGHRSHPEGYSRRPAPERRMEEQRRAPSQRGFEGRGAAERGQQRPALRPEHGGGAERRGAGGGGGGEGRGHGR